MYERVKNIKRVEGGGSWGEEGTFPLFLSPSFFSKFSAPTIAFLAF